jgi:hypothetical protein
MRIVLALCLAAGAALAVTQDETALTVAVKLSMTQVQALDEAGGAEVTIKFDENQLKMIRAAFPEATLSSVLASAAHLRDDNTLLLQLGPDGELTLVINP